MSKVDEVKELITEGHKQDAFKKLISILQQNSKDIEAWLLLSEVVDDPEKKRDCYEKILEISPNHSLAFHKLRKLNISSFVSSVESSKEIKITQPKIFHQEESEASSVDDDWKFWGLIILAIIGVLVMSYILGFLLIGGDSSTDISPLCMGMMTLGVIASIYIWVSSKKNRKKIVNKAIKGQKKYTSSSSANSRGSSRPAPKSSVVSCRICQHTVSRTAPSCPNCGELYPGLISKCPHCGSKNISVSPKGFSLGKATAGAVLAGPVGLAGGLHGRKDLVVKCSSCHRTTKIKPHEI